MITMSYKDGLPVFSGDYSLVSSLVSEKPFYVSLAFYSSACHIFTSLNSNILNVATILEFGLIKMSNYCFRLAQNTIKKNPTTQNYILLTKFNESDPVYC